MSLPVHLLHPPEPPQLERLHTALGDRVRWVDAGACAVLVGGTPTEEQLDASPDLHTLVIPYAGLPRRTRRFLLERPHLRVHNLHHNAQATAEMAVALLLAAAKVLIPCDRELRSGRWLRGEPGIQLSGRTAVVLGYGAVGRRVGAALRGLGMDVIGVRRRPSDDDPHVLPADALDEVLPRAQALVVCLPSTDATKDLLGPERLAALPDDALLVNVGRARIIDERALYEALRDRRLFAAGLDVWYRYPESQDHWDDQTLPAEHPFWDLDNVVLGPHRAARTERNEDDRMDHLADVLRALADGQPAPGPVDVDAGY